MRNVPLLLLLGAGALSAGCTGSQFGYSGFSTSDYFAVDGNRTWRYVHDDDEQILEVVKTSSAENRSGAQVYQFDYALDGVLAYTIWWSSDGDDGVLVHEFSDETTGTSATFSPPIQIAEPEMTSDDAVSTSSGGYQVTSTFIGTQDCPNEWNTEDTWECLYFQISDGSDSAESPPFVGDFWLAANYGASRFQLPRNGSEWILSSASYEP